MKSSLFLSPGPFHQVRWYLFGFFVFAMQGCADPLYWVKPGAQANDFERDRLECQEGLGLSSDTKGMQGVSIFDPSIGTASTAIEQCLADKGWYLARKPTQ